MVDARSAELEITINGRDFTIRQSPGALQSSRKEGTTGAAVWRTCVSFAKWLSLPGSYLFAESLLDRESTVVELGSGISGLIPLILSPRVKSVVATDQQHVLKLLRENIDANSPLLGSKPASLKAVRGHAGRSNIQVSVLDWETHDVASAIRSQGLEAGVDAVLVCDCIFNYALIRPLVDACVAICKLRAEHGSSVESPSRPTICVIAQQLRQHEVFEQWLSAFMLFFDVWRIPEDMLGIQAGTAGPFVVHVGVLREHYLSTRARRADVRCY